MQRKDQFAKGCPGKRGAMMSGCSIGPWPGCRDTAKQADIIGVVYFIGWSSCQSCLFFRSTAAETSASYLGLSISSR
jgi:hypothetical protein